MNQTLSTILLLTSLLNPWPCFAAAADADNLAREATEKGWRYFEIGDQATALKRFRQAIILDPDYAPGYVGVGTIYRLQNRPSRAIQYYRKAIELADPPDSPTHAGLGLALLQAGQQQESFQMLQRALEIDPNNADVYISLSSYYCAQKHGKLARESLEKAAALGAPTDPKLYEELKTNCP